MAAKRTFRAPVKKKEVAKKPPVRATSTPTPRRKKLGPVQQHIADLREAERLFGRKRKK